MNGYLLINTWWETKKLSPISMNFDMPDNKKRVVKIIPRKVDFNFVISKIIRILHSIRLSLIKFTEQIATNMSISIERYLLS